MTPSLFLARPSQVGKSRLRRRSLSALFVCLQATALCSSADDSAANKIPAAPFRVSGSDMMADLTGVERELYRKGREAFSRMSSVQGDVYVPETEVGLGPAFNGDSCISCHAYPTLGGSSPAMNPQFGIAVREGAHNLIPSFVSKSGPALQVRFRHKYIGRGRWNGSSALYYCWPPRCSWMRVGATGFRTGTKEPQSEFSDSHSALWLTW